MTLSRLDYERLIISALAEKPMTCKEITESLKTKNWRIKSQLQVMRGRTPKTIKIVGWQLLARSRPSAIYALGSEADAEKPIDYSADLTDWTPRNRVLNLPAQIQSLPTPRIGIWGI